MGDPSLEVTEESHDSSQEAEGMVMEAITRRYYNYCKKCQYY
jgi:hypothetical protein